MGKYFVKRVLLLIPTILLVCVIVFILMRMIPMDAVATLQQKLSANGNYVDEDVYKRQRKSIVRLVKDKATISWFAVVSIV